MRRHRSIVYACSYTVDYIRSVVSGWIGPLRPSWRGVGLIRSGRTARIRNFLHYGSPYRQFFRELKLHPLSAGLIRRLKIQFAEGNETEEGYASQGWVLPRPDRNGTRRKPPIDNPHDSSAAAQAARSTSAIDCFNVRCMYGVRAKQSTDAVGSQGTPRSRARPRRTSGPHGGYAPH